VQKRWRLVLLLVAALGLGATERPARGNASGCTGMPGGPDISPDGRPNCGASGSWCYLCEYSYPYGYTLCAEAPNTDDGFFCTDYQY
jgi:hypothetical protein